ncbi:MAG TPA: hypothetical protein VKO85_02370 [Wenzhouxiangellaceae bacterium]|nr:hypothetical protein [Wenzhouxiangellaceae bacterium]
MNTTLTGRFEQVDQARVARKDMIAAGIPQEKIYIDEERQEIKVIIPEPESRQILEVFKNHNIAEAR